MAKFPETVAVAASTTESGVLTISHQDRDFLYTGIVITPRLAGTWPNWGPDKRKKVLGPGRAKMARCTTSGARAIDCVQQQLLVVGH